MAKAVRWTPKALETYIAVLHYLRTHWTSREEQNFVDEVESTIKFITAFPNGFRSAGHKRLREAQIKPYNILLYRVDLTEIILIGFFDMRQHPKALRAMKRGWREK